MNLSTSLLQACAHAQADIYLEGEIPGASAVLRQGGVTCAAIPCIVDGVEYCIITTRGTDSIQAALANWPMPANLLGIRTYAGLVERAKVVASFAVEHCRRKPVLWTGHSQGGAVSMLAPHVFGDAISTHAIVTFGCPKPVGPWYPLADKCVHVVRNKDLVTYVPIMPRWSMSEGTFVAWHRPGRELLFNDDGRLIKRGLWESIPRRLEWAFELELFNLDWRGLESTNGIARRRIGTVGLVRCHPIANPECVRAASPYAIACRSRTAALVGEADEPDERGVHPSPQTICRQSLPRNADCSSLAL
jgi:hypothetical protein